MGLPLFRAPVESDIRAKVPKDPPTRARSTIRRDRRTVGIGGSDASLAPSHHRFYARRRGRLVSPRAADGPWSLWDNIGSEDTSAPSRTAPPRGSSFTTEPYPPPRDAARHDDAPRSTRQTDSALREVAQRSGMSQDMARYFGEHMAMLHAATSSRPMPRTPHTEEVEERERERDETEALSGDVVHRAWIVPSDPSPPASLVPRSTTTPGSRQPDTATRSNGGSRTSGHVVLRRQDGHLIAMRRLRAVLVTPAPGDGTQQDATAVDGLGDRDRSLSPEDDGVWDTLLGSIAPDPQPPSVGTSFASNSSPASAGTSQSIGGSTGTATSASSSAHTHITVPATLDALDRDGDFDFEHPCDENNTDTEGDEEDEEERRVNTLRRFDRQPSYAEVVGRREEEDLELSGGGVVDDMLRIVRNLARREDIPDEWWAEAGLSRSLPREA